MNDLGYNFEHELVDTQKFLLPQRRNRCWGTADLIRDGSTAEIMYARAMKDTMSRLSSPVRFSADQMLEEGLPESEDQLSDRKRQVISNALQKAE